MELDLSTVLVLIKLTKFAVALRFRCGCGNLIFCLFYHVLRYLRTLYIVWSLGRRRVTELNSLKWCVAVAVRLRLFFQFT